MCCPFFQATKRAGYALYMAKSLKCFWQKDGDIRHRINICEKNLKFAELIGVPLCFAVRWNAKEEAGGNGFWNIYR